MNNLSVLAFYRNLGEQAHRKFYAYGDIYNLIAPNARFLPFQIRRNTLQVPPALGTGPAPVNKCRLWDLEAGTFTDVLAEAQTAGLYVKQFLAGGFDLIIFPSLLDFPSLVMAQGRYYLEIGDGVNTWFSEVFTVIQNLAPYLKLEYWDTLNIEYENAELDYSLGFRWYCYLQTEIGKPQYTFTEEATDRDGFKFVEKQLSEKRYGFTFLANEPLADALRIARLHDNIRITFEGREYVVEDFLLTVEWEEQGNLAAVVCEFETDTVVKKIGRASEPQLTPAANLLFSAQPGDAGLYQPYLSWDPSSDPLAVYDLFESTDGGLTWLKIADGITDTFYQYPTTSFWSARWKVETRLDTFVAGTTNIVKAIRLQTPPIDSNLQQSLKIDTVEGNGEIFWGDGNSSSETGGEIIHNYADRIGNKIIWVRYGNLLELSRTEPTSISYLETRITPDWKNFQTVNFKAVQLLQGDISNLTGIQYFRSVDNHNLLVGSLNGKNVNYWELPGTTGITGDIAFINFLGAATLIFGGSGISGDIGAASGYATLVLPNSTVAGTLAPSANLVKLDLGVSGVITHDLGNNVSTNLRFLQLDRPTNLISYTGGWVSDEVFERLEIEAQIPSAQLEALIIDMDGVLLTPQGLGEIVVNTDVIPSSTAFLDAVDSLQNKGFTISISDVLLPGTPENFAFTASPGTGGFYEPLLSWSQPPPAEVPATQFALEESIDGGVSWSIVTETASLSYLRDATTNWGYQFRVRSKEGAFYGKPSAIIKTFKFRVNVTAINQKTSFTFTYPSGSGVYYWGEGTSSAVPSEKTYTATGLYNVWLSYSFGPTFFSTNSANTASYSFDIADFFKAFSLLNSVSMQGTHAVFGTLAAGVLPSSLTSFNVQGQNTIGGTLAAGVLPSGLVSFTLQGQNTIGGSLAAGVLPSGFTTLNVTGQNTIGGSLAAGVLPSGFVSLLVLGQNTIGGALAAGVLPSSMTSINLQGLNVLSGSLAAGVLPSGFTAITVRGNNTIGGSLAAGVLPSSLTFFDIQGQNTIGGALAAGVLPSGVTIFELQGQNTLGGSLAAGVLPSVMSRFIVGGQNTLGGALAAGVLPSNMTNFTVTGQNTIGGNINVGVLPSALNFGFNVRGNNTIQVINVSSSTCTYFELLGLCTANGGVVSSIASNNSFFRILPTVAGKMSSTDVDNMLIALDSLLATNSGTIDLSGNNDPRTAASDAAVTSLIAKNRTVTTN